MGLLFDKPIVALSFFSGAGGLDIGMRQAGITPCLVNEINPDAIETLRTNFGNTPLISDINDCHKENVYRTAGLTPDQHVDVIFGGPPCQAFSTAGKRKGFEDARGNLLIKYLDLINEIRPTYVVIENVRGLLSAKAILSDKQLEGVKGGVLSYTVHKLRESGYAVSFNLYNTANFGVSEKRERVVIIAKLGHQKVSYLRPTNSEHGEFGLPRWSSFKDVTSDLIESKQHFLPFPKRRVKYLPLIPEGGNWRSLPLELQKEAMGKSYYLGGGKTGFLRRLSYDKPSPTLVTVPTMPATDLIHPAYDRCLSVEEYKRIQGFPDSWEIKGSLVAQYRQIGNAVPIGFAYAIGKHILADMRQRSSTIQNFQFSRYKNTSDQTWQDPNVAINKH